MMKKAILPILIVFTMGGYLVAQQEQGAPQVELESFEKCNNWARHYCQSGTHEELVNNGLLAWKKRGIQITTKRIKLLAQRIRQNLGE